MWSEVAKLPLKSATPLLSSCLGTDRADWKGRCDPGFSGLGSPHGDEKAAIKAMHADSESLIKLEKDRNKEHKAHDCGTSSCWRRSRLVIQDFGSRPEEREIKVTQDTGMRDRNIAALGWFMVAGSF